jgi:acetyltransferase-like isoleucine patch superfamily enzyme
MRLKLILRVMLPSFFARAYYYARFGALLSAPVEVDISRLAQWGSGIQISSFATIKIAGPFRVGDNARIGNGCVIAVESAGVAIGNEVMIGPGCSLLNSNYRYDRLDFPLRLQGRASKGITIGDYVWIGANCVILDGATIGRNVIVAAGSVVSGEVPDNAIIQGNPASVVFLRRP